MRNSDIFKEIVTFPDAAHNQKERRTEVSKGKLQEAMAGWQFAQERGFVSVKSGGAEIDFIGQDSTGSEVPFDPFMSPMAGPNQVPNENARTNWAQASSAGSYYKHTHSKGGQKGTVGVWDKTYTTKALEADLKDRLSQSGSDQDANVHEVRVPLARMYAEEHVAAEEQIDRDKGEQAREMAHWKSVEQRYNKAQRGKNAEQKISFAKALTETDEHGRPTQRALHWSKEIKNHKKQ